MQSEPAGALVPLHIFKRSGRCPVSVYHLTFAEKPAMIAAGALVPFGRRLLVDEARFFQYLRDRARNGRAEPEPAKRGRRRAGVAPR